MIVCHCKVVNDRDVVEAMQTGARTLGSDGVDGERPRLRRLRVLDPSGDV